MQYRIVYQNNDDNNSSYGAHGIGKTTIVLMRVANELKAGEAMRVAGVGAKEVGEPIT